MLNVIDEFTRECLAIRVSRKLSMSSMYFRTCLRVRDDRDHGFQMIVIIHSSAA
jgi:hypothetical protein